MAAAEIGFRARFWLIADARSSRGESKIGADINLAGRTGVELGLADIIALFAAAAETDLAIKGGGFFTGAGSGFGFETLGSGFDGVFEGFFIELELPAVFEIDDEGLLEFGFLSLLIEF